jgi:hypothetical protein
LTAVGPDAAPSLILQKSARPPLSHNDRLPDEPFARRSFARSAAQHAADHASSKARIGAPALLLYQTL